MPDDTTVTATPTPYPTVWVEAGTTLSPRYNYVIQDYSTYGLGTLGGIVYYSGNAPEFRLSLSDSFWGEPDNLKESDLEDVESGLP